jgi:threonine/homoserine/homoserine lactone efflux protein
MTVTEAMLAFALVAGLLTIVPGLDTALVLRGTLTRNRRYGFSAALGIQAGTLVWGAAAATGAAALLAASQTAYRVLTVLGAAYMVWLGASMLWSSFRTPAQREAVPTTSARAQDGFAMGLVTNLTNPKVGAFYVATIPQFVPDGVSPLVMGLALAALHCVLGMAWFTAIILGADRLGPRLRASSAVRWVDRATGGVLVALGARLAASARS